MRIVQRWGLILPAIVALSTAAIPAVPSVAVAQEVLTVVTDKRMETILGGMGFDYTKVKDGTYKFELNGYKVLMILDNGNTDAQLYFALGDVQTTAAKMNAWNKKKRFSRAYMDDDGNPALESDLNFDGGITEDNIKTFIKLYRSLMKSFVEHIQS
jgi:hypothetical protein